MPFPTAARRAALLLFTAAPLLTGGCSRTVRVSSAPAPATVITEADVRHLLTALAADSMEGRGTGTAGSAKAARLIAGEMRAAGLEPAGDSGYFQRVPVALEARTFRGRNGETMTRSSPTLFPSFAALDTVPGDRRLTAVNVVGILRGSDPALRDSVVLVDAHYDHLGRAGVVGSSCRAQGADSICNGADDDASGTVAVMEIAKALAAGPRPRRTIVFAANTGEEVGLLGTRWFVTHPPIPLSHFEANLEIEMIGRPDSLAGGAGRAWLTGFERSTMGASFAAAGLPIVPDERPAQQFFQRSDNIAFARAGIPAHTLSTFNLHADYHQPSDDASRVDFAHMTGVIRAGAAAVGILANGPAPRWNPGGEP